jgi:hypothetical protein
MMRAYAFFCRIKPVLVIMAEIDKMVYTIDDAAAMVAHTLSQK